MSKREDSTPAGTPGAQERRSPGFEMEGQGNRSPSLRREPLDLASYGGKPKWILNKGSWETTGVMNSIPAARHNELLRARDGEDGRRVEGRSRSVSKQMLAKTTFEQKQKMVEALDNARAAELALREMLGAFRAAKQRVDGLSIFDYDPLSLDFPSLTLHCLPPPPTLHQTTPVATSKSWSILPPGDQQYEALRAHFSTEFHRWRIASSIATATPQDDLSYPPQPIYSHFDDPSELAQRAEEEASELESKISEHLHNQFGHWNSLPALKRSEIWTLSLARDVGRKSEEMEKLKKEKDYAQQQAAHLQIQVDELSRLQHPREFRLAPPRTIPIDSKLMNEIGELVNTPGVGLNFTSRDKHIDVAVEQAIGRWRDVVREARGGGSGLAGQRSLSGDSSSTQPPPSAQLKQPTPTQTQNQNQSQDVNHSTNTTITNGADMGSDQDADADADMEEDDSYAEMMDAPHSGQRAPEAPLAQGTNFRLTNGNNSQGGVHTVMEGLENQTCVQGYVRIGA